MRHGESENNVADILSSTITDGYPLTAKGREQVAAQAEKLAKEERIDAIIASPLLRTYETAEIVAKKVEAPLFKDARLKEPFFGDFEGKSFKAYAAKSKSHKLEDVNGESSASIRKRTGELIQEVDSKYKGKTVLLVTHSFTMVQIFKYLKKELHFPMAAEYFILEI